MAQSVSGSDLFDCLLGPFNKEEKECSKILSSYVDYKYRSESPNPKRLKTLAFNVKHSKRNNLLQQFVQDNSYPNKCISKNCINGVLRAMSGVSVNALNDDGYSALHLAVLANNIVMVERLLLCLGNIDVNQKCGVFPENTALHFAVTLGYLSIVEKLLDKGASVNIHNRNGDTALYFAVETGALDMLQLLVSKGADVNVKDKTTTFPLHHVAHSGNLDAVKCLVSSGADVNVETITGCTPIFAAVKSRNLPIVEFLISNGADVNAEDKLNKSLLHYAVKSESLEIIEFLVDNGADVNARDYCNETVLQYAKEAGSSEIVEFLVSEGAKLKVTKKQKKTSRRKTNINLETLFFMHHFESII